MPALKVRPTMNGKRLDNSECESMRELAVFSKSGLLRDQASIAKLNNYFKKLVANSDQIESLIANIVDSPELQKCIDVAKQIAQLSSILLDQMADYVERQKGETQRIKHEIEKVDVILKQKNVNIRTLEGHEKLEKELKI